MEYGLDNKTAACGLLAELTGVAGALCTQPYDCHCCDVFNGWAAGLPPDITITWACFRCVAGPGDARLAQGRLLGYYAEGLCSWCGLPGILLNAVGSQI